MYHENVTNFINAGENKVIKKKGKFPFIISIVVLTLFMGLTVGPKEEIAQLTQNPSDNTESVANSVENDDIVEDDEPSVAIESSSGEPANVSRAADVTFSGYKEIIVDGGNTSGYRKPMVVVDIGFGDREYWAFTNEYGQLVRVIAQKIVLQNHETEPVNSDGRYYDNEADVPGTEREDLDQGHVIADSLGGVSNAYNITPQDSIMNRYGDQAYMEKAIRDAGGCTNFEAIITYPDTNTQIPSHYHYTYTINGNVITEDFDNINPDEANKAINSAPAPTPVSDASGTGTPNLSSVDTNGNGKVTISEAKAAGFKMPISRDHWLYPYMDDRDGDGLVGE